MKTEETLALRGDYLYVSYTTDFLPRCCELPANADHPSPHTVRIAEGQMQLKLFFLTDKGNEKKIGYHCMVTCRERYQKHNNSRSVKVTTKILLLTLKIF